MKHWPALALTAVTAAAVAGFALQARRADELQRVLAAYEGAGIQLVEDGDFESRRYSGHTTVILIAAGSDTQAVIGQDLYRLKNGLVLGSWAGTSHACEIRSESVRALRVGPNNWYQPRPLIHAWNEAYRKACREVVP
jgi:hypothetical protein